MRIARIWRIGRIRSSRLTVPVRGAMPTTEQIRPIRKIRAIRIPGREQPLDAGVTTFR